MAINTQTIRIDLNPGKTIPVAFVHQNDTNRQLTFQLYNNGEAFTPSSTTVKFAYKSPIVNGQYSVITGSQMASGTVSGNTVTVTLPAAYTQVSGVGLLTMILTTSGNTLRPVNIKFVCQSSADGDDSVLGASDWPEGLYDYMDDWLAENEPTEIANLKSDLSETTGNIFYPFSQKQAIATSGDTTTLVPASYNTTDCAIIPCAEGDTFTISGEGLINFRLWAFVGAETNSTYPILTKSAGNAVANKVVLTAPADAEYLVVNVKRTPTNYSGSVCKNKLLATTVSEMKNEVESGFDAVNEELTAKERIFGVPSENASVVTTTGKLYDVTTKTEVTFSNGRYSVLDNLVADTFLVVSGYAFSSNDLYPLYALYDSNNNLLETYGSPNTAYNNVLIHITDNVSKIVVTGSGAYPPAIKNYTPTDLKEYIDNGFAHNSIWSGKRIGILGTSVAFGALSSKSYPFEASELLGCQLSMFAVPGLAIEQTSDGSPKEYGSFTCSISDYTSAGWTIPSAPVTPYVPGGSYNDYYRTYENVFVQENADIDLWVYAVVPNNTNFALDDWNSFNKTEWKYNDNSAFSTHCKTFLGALIFIMDQMYTLNPNARMVLAIDSTFSYTNGLEALQTVSAQWNIPIINLWGKINTSPKSLVKLKSENGTNSHPSTFAHEIMGKMFAGELELIS